MNLEEIRAKLKGMEAGRPRNNKWKPKDEHTVRLLPLPGDEDIAVVIKWHYGVDNGRQMACPTTWGDDCSFCAFAEFLKSWKDDKGKDKPELTRKRDWDLFKKLQAADKHYSPCVVRKKDSLDVEGPFLWEMTPKTYGAVLKICANDDWNEEQGEGGGLKVLTSLTRGLDLVVTLKKKGEKGNTTSFDLTEVEERKKFSPIFKGDDAKARALLEKIPPIDSIAKRVTTEEADKVFRTWQASANGEAGEGLDNSDGEERSSNSAERAASGGADVDETVRRLEALIGPKA
jgi:hypothetical protein